MGSKKAQLAAAGSVVRRYYGLLNAPTSASSANSLEAIMLPTCKCREIVSSLRSAVQNQEHYVGSGHLTALRPVFDSPTQTEVLVTFDATSGGLVREDGTYVHRTAPQRGVTENVFVLWRAHRWMVREVDLISKGR
jgi:hypothetical protein